MKNTNLKLKKFWQTRNSPSGRQIRASCWRDDKSNFCTYVQVLHIGFHRILE